jgi:hypothetical protein
MDMNTKQQRPNKTPSRKERPGHKSVTIHLYESKPHDALILKYLNDQGMRLSDAVKQTLHHVARQHVRRVATGRHECNEKEVRFLTDAELLTVLSNSAVNTKVVAPPAPKTTPKPLPKPQTTSKEEMSNEDDDVDF